jgi:predicted NBD/HSP70 family sugar kinase
MPPATAIVAAANAGDEDAKTVLREAGEALGEAAALIALVLDPERIVLTGGLS